MAFFNIFSKEKKEVLDQGLAETKQSFFSKFTRAIGGKSTIDAAILDSLEEILVTADVGVDTTLRIIKKIEQRIAKDRFEDEKAQFEKEIQLKREEMERELGEREKVIAQKEVELNIERRNRFFIS